MVTKWSGHINIVVIRAIHGLVQVGFVPNPESTRQIRVAKKLIYPWPLETTSRVGFGLGQRQFVSVQNQPRATVEISTSVVEILTNLIEIWPNLGGSRWNLAGFASKDRRRPIRLQFFMRRPTNWPPRFGFWKWKSATDCYWWQVGQVSVQVKQL